MAKVSTYLNFTNQTEAALIFINPFLKQKKLNQRT